MRKKNTAGNSNIEKRSEFDVSRNEKTIFKEKGGKKKQSNFVREQLLVNFTSMFVRKKIGRNRAGAAQRICNNLHTRSVSIRDMINNREQDFGKVDFRKIVFYDTKTTFLVKLVTTMINFKTNEISTKVRQFCL